MFFFNPKLLATEEHCKQFVISSNNICTSQCQVSSIR